jgi:hypothetical protein
MGKGFLQVPDWGKFPFAAYVRMRLPGLRAGINSRLTFKPEFSTF